MSDTRSDFIRDIIDADLKSGRHQHVATRFPPEPNGYLHIGHAKSICLNFGLARDYQGTCNLRYDDTNPEKEEVEYVESIERDVRWLGFAPAAVLFSADYFPKMYQLAEKLITEGNAYVCDLTNDEIKEYRGSLTEPGKNSPYRARSVDENLDLFRRMRAGEFADSARTLRGKIDMASPNMKMRDPMLYRIRKAHHHRTGDAWCIYPMYDYAHPLEDAIEKITHSICTLEFENNRELYDWVIEKTGISKELGVVEPRQHEFARLQLEYTVMSKRKLLTLVKDKHVTGWDDPRMPTISGMRRRGFAPEALRAFCDMIGVAKANSFVDIAKLEGCVRHELNQNAERRFGVIDPIEVVIAGAPAATTIDAASFPPDIGKPGSRPVPLSGRVFIDRDDWRDDPPADYQRLAPGRTVRLRYAHCITVAADGVERDASGKVTKLHATVSDEKKASAIHWVDAATSVPCEVRIYDRLFLSAKPEEAGEFVDQIDKNSLKVIGTARLEQSLANAPIGTRFQLERVGYFVVDPDSTPDRLVLSRTITLRETYAAEVKPSDKKVNAKAERRKAAFGKDKSPKEYRAEARARDVELAAAYEWIKSLAGVTEDQADLLTGELEIARFFRTAVESPASGQKIDPSTAAKLAINELPRALGDKELDETALTPVHFAELIDALGTERIQLPAAKAALAQMVATGKRLAELDLGTTVDAGQLHDAVTSVLASHPDKVAQYRGGKTGLLGFLVGQVMKAAPGADATAVNTALRTALG